MHTPRKRTTLLSAIAIGVVATMGLGFALWTETLNVDATVNTGELNVAFANATATDNDDGGQADGTCTAELGPDGNSLTVALDNAYPGYSCDITVDVANTGTVDAVVADVLEDTDSDPTSNGMITITRSGIAVGDVIADGDTQPVTYTVEVDSTATETDVAENASYAIGASIDFENATP